MGVVVDRCGRSAHAARGRFERRGVQAVAGGGGGGPRSGPPAVFAAAPSSLPALTTQSLAPGEL